MNKIRYENLVFLLLSSILFSCNSAEDKNINDEVPTGTNINDSISERSEEKSSNKNNYEPEIAYIFLHINSYADLDSFKRNYTDDQRRIISDLNRIDENRIKPVDSIVIPDIFFDSLFFYSPFPFYVTIIRDIKKIYFVSREIQAFAAYEAGKLVRWGPSILGKKSTPTPAGLFFANWKAKSTISTVNEDWLMKWYFNIHNFRGISIHEYAMPGYPASHACVRLKEDDAKWFYDWAQQWILSDDGQTVEYYGTPVIIYDSYNFDELPPWKLLPTNPDTTHQPVQHLEEVVEPHLELIIERQAERKKYEQNVF